MRTALGGGAAPLLLGAGGLVLGAAVVVGGGSSDDRLFWVGGAAVLVAGTAVAAALAGVVATPRLTRAGAVFLGFLAAFVVWNGVSVVWSIAPDRSWDYFNRGLAYLAFALLGLLVAVHVRRPATAAAAGIGLAAAVAVGWGLLGKIVPAIASDNERIARLHLPLGYWNALALLVDLAAPVALWAAARREHPHWLRAGATTALYAGGVALLLTYSRAGIAVAAIAVALWLLLGRPRLESAAVLALAAPSALAVGGLGFSLSGIAADRQPYHVRVVDGAWFGVALVLVGAVVFGLAYVASRSELERRLSPARRRVLGKAAATAAGAAIVVATAAVLATAHPSSWLREFTSQTSPAAAGSPEHLTTLSSSSRWDWWREAWHAFRDQPLHGTGAASFELTHYMLRRNTFYVSEPHSLPLQFLSETGIVGFLLAAGAAAAALAGATGALRRLEGAERAAAAALTVGLIVYLLHAIGDFDWDFVAVTAPVLLAAGVFAGADRAPPPRREPIAAAAAAAVVLGCLYSFAAPWVAARDVRSAYAAIDAGKARGAAGDGRRAHSLNPLAVDPLLAEAAAKEQLGDDGAARRLYVQAIDVQPLNWRPWFSLGSFEADRGNVALALRYVERASALNPRGIGVVTLLDQLRARSAGG